MIVDTNRGAGWNPRWRVELAAKSIGHSASGVDEGSSRTQTAYLVIREWHNTAERVDLLVDDRRWLDYVAVRSKLRKKIQSLKSVNVPRSSRRRSLRPAEMPV